MSPVRFRILDHLLEGRDPRRTFRNALSLGDSSAHGGGDGVEAMRCVRGLARVYRSTYNRRVVRSRCEHLGQRSVGHASRRQADRRTGGQSRNGEEEDGRKEASWDLHD